MLGDVVEFLLCPHCGEGLSLKRGSVRCERGHSFDVARQGYVSLLSGAASPTTGDRAAMVHARAEFMGSGHYASLTQAVADVAESALGPMEGCIVDVGAGTGHYLAGVLDTVVGIAGVAADVSRHALRRAARAHPRLGAVGCDAWRQIPVRTGAAVLVLNVFAPRNGAEMSRILRPRAPLIVVTPTTRHLGELVSRLGLLTVDRAKAERVADMLHPYFALAEQTTHEFSLALSRRDVANLVTMGPSAWHVRADSIEQRTLALPEPMMATASVSLSVYERR